jgi:hypothetical protein
MTVSAAVADTRVVMPASVAAVQENGTAVNLAVSVSKAAAAADTFAAEVLTSGDSCHLRHHQQR